MPESRRNFIGAFLVTQALAVTASLTMTDCAPKESPLPRKPEQDQYIRDAQRALAELIHNNKTDEFVEKLGQIRIDKPSILNSVYNDSVYTVPSIGGTGGNIVYRGFSIYGNMMDHAAFQGSEKMMDILEKHYAKPTVAAFAHLGYFLNQKGAERTVNRYSETKRIYERLKERFPAVHEEYEAMKANGLPGTINNPSVHAAKTPGERRLR